MYGSKSASSAEKTALNGIITNLVMTAPDLSLIRGMLLALKSSFAKLLKSKGS